MVSKTRWAIVAAVVTLLLVAVKAPADEAERTVDHLRRRAAELQSQAASLSRSGREDEARSVAAHAAETLKALANAERQFDAQRRTADLERRIEQLGAVIREHQIAGRQEEAQRLMSELKSLQTALEAARRPRPDPNRPQPTEHAEDAHGEHAHGEHAHGEHAHGEHAHAEHDDPAHHAEHEAIGRRIHHLRMAAENLAAAGLDDQARELHAQAERMERELQPRPEVPPQIREMREQMERMQDQINQLREIVEDLRRAVERR